MTLSPFAPTSTIAGGPLTGIRVLDLSSIVMGPLATQILGDLGADVVTIEPPGGDPGRAIGAGTNPQLSGTSLNLLRNKRNISLDMKKPDGIAAALRLAATCDVVVTNLRPGPLKRLGFDYESVAKVRQDIIYCQAQGFPSDSDRADEAAYDDAIQASSGMADVLGKLAGRPSLAPIVIADKLCGLTIVYAVNAALYHRAMTGEGQRIEVPMHDTVAAFVLVEHAAAAAQVPPLGPPGYARILTPNRGPYSTSDGFVLLIPYTRTDWVQLLESGGATGFADDPRLADAASRLTQYDDLYDELSKIVATRSTAEWRTWCQEHNIASSEIASLEEIVEACPIVEHPVIGAHRSIPSPVRFSATPPSIRRPAPLIGQHNVEVFEEIGFTEEEIAALQNSGALNDGPMVVG